MPALTEKLKPFLLPALAVLLTVLAFYPVVSNGFTSWDDPQYVTQNSLIRDFSLSGLAHLFHPDSRALDTYTPLTLVSFAADYALAENDASWYHWVNLLLHLLNTALVFALVARLTGQRFTAFVVAALFGVHPMHVESVAWITERKDLLFTPFYLGACILYLTHLRKHSSKLLSVPLARAWGFFILAILAKPQAVSLPLVLWLIHYWESGRFSLSAFRSLWPFLGLSVASGLFALSIMEPNPPAYSWLERVWLSGEATWQYLYKFALPLGLNHNPAMPAGGAIPTSYYATTALALVLLGAGLWLGRNKREVVVGLLFFVATLALGLHVLKINSGLAYERFSYLPYIGLALPLGALLNWLRTVGTTARNSVFVAIGLVLISFAVLSNQRSRVWQNDFTLWTAALDADPANKLGWCKRASWLKNEGKLEQALKEQAACVQANRDLAQPLNNLGQMQAQAGQVVQAFSSYNRAIAMDSTLAIALANRGILYMQQGQTAAGLADLALAAQRDTTSTLFLLNLGAAYEMTEQPQQALQAYSLAIKREPLNHVNWKYRGALLAALNRPHEAVADFTQAIHIKSDYADAWYQRALAHTQLANAAQAASDMKQARALGHPKAASPTHQ